MGKLETALEDALGYILQSQGIDLMASNTPDKLKFPNCFRWRYYGKLKLARGIKAYCHSTTKNANGKYLSWIYQPRIAEGKWDYTEIREHAKRKDAKARSLKLYLAH